jgi:hypothetical protein
MKYQRIVIASALGTPEHLCNPKDTGAHRVPELKLALRRTAFTGKRIPPTVKAAMVTTGAVAGMFGTVSAIV